jgi:O-antigen/teichoic acid export membrane protein
MIRKNIAANFVSQGLTVALAFAFVPVTIRFLGIAAYALIGFSATLQSVFVLLDLGLSSTLNREMATLSARSDSAQQMRDVLRTFEVVYWFVAALIATVVVLSAPYVAHHWMRSSQLSPEVIQSAIKIMGLVLAIQWPFSLYAGGLLGLQKQVFLSVLNATYAVLRNVGAVLILWLVSPTVQAFFLWQILTALLQTTVALQGLWNAMPSTACRAKFRFELIHQSRHFAAGMTGITLTALLITQLDKIILSKTLSLEAFGYYVLAGNVATAPFFFVGPVFAALYPHFTQLVAAEAHERLRAVYHQSCQFLAAVTLPIAAVVSVFAGDIIFVWTNDRMIAAQAHLILTLLAFGSVLNGLMNLPYALQLAHRWTGLSLNINVVAVSVLAPLMAVMSVWYGATGAASVSILINVACLVAGIHFMHRRLLKGQRLQWYLGDILPAFVSSALAALLCFAVAPSQLMRGPLLAMLVVVTLIVMAASLFTTPVTRRAIIDYYRAGKLRHIVVQPDSASR